jgi:hypothetical protein
MGETTRVPRVETPPGVESTTLPSPSIPRRSEEVGALKTPKNDLSSALRALVKYYDDEGQFSPEKMDPQTGGLFEEEFLALLGTEDKEVIKALKDAGFIVIRSRPKVVDTLTVWPTGKGLVEGRKKDSDSPESKE